MFSLRARLLAKARISFAKKIRQAAGDFDLNFQLACRPVFSYVDFVWRPQDPIYRVAIDADLRRSYQAGKMKRRAISQHA